MKKDFFFDRLSENTQKSNLMKIRPVGAELFHADGRTADMTMTIVAFRNFAKQLKNSIFRLHSAFMRFVWTFIYNSGYVFCVDLRTNSDYFPIQH